MNVSEATISTVDRLVAKCKDREAFWQEVGYLDPWSRVTTHDQLWDSLMQLAHQKNQDLRRKDVTSKMQSSVEYQAKMGCTEPAYVCRRKTCVNSNPSCVSQKISEHIEIIRQHLAYLQ